MGFRVIKSGPLTTVQDGGRLGWQHMGVSPSGPMDLKASAWANYLLGNPWGTPVLEVTFGGLELEALVATWVAICGADLPVYVNNRLQPRWASFPIYRGDVLRLGWACQGQRSYLAVADGFSGAPVLGSLACHLREGLGGFAGNGLAVADGDGLSCAPLSSKRRYRAQVPSVYWINDGRPTVLRVMKGGDYDAFCSEAQHTFWKTAWRVSPQSDRMGIRLEGAVLQSPRRQYSLGVVTGCIQVPPDGRPVVLMADRQTMGGYPILGWLHPCDVWRLAQCIPRQSFSVVPESLPAAQQDLRCFYRFFRG